MKVSRAQMEENHRIILDAASHLFRAKGFEAVSVSEVMRAAGLTHGGFYGHFRSKDDLIAETLSYSLERSSRKGTALHATIDRYLSPRHRDNAGEGCPVAGLAAETRYQTPAARKAMTHGLRAQFERLSQESPELEAEEKRRSAIGRWSAMVGAVILARAVDDPNFSDEILEQTREWLHQGLPQDRPSNVTPEDH